MRLVFALPMLDLLLSAADASYTKRRDAIHEKNRRLTATVCGQEGCGEGCT
jgi:hypothetical protein